MATYSPERFEEGRAYAKAHPAPDHVVAAVNRALRAPRRGDGGDPDAEIGAGTTPAASRLVDVAH